MTNVAGLALGRYAFAIDGFGQYARTGGFTHAARTTEKERMRQVTRAYGVFQRGGNMLLPHHRIKGLGSVFTCRNNEFFHVKNGVVLKQLFGMKIENSNCKKTASSLNSYFTFLLFHFSFPAVDKCKYFGHPCGTKLCTVC
jgi:hypothetical protein